ncbi:MAG: hypothetical protein AAFY02_14475 [Pseudomonadota bacterium]
MVETAVGGAADVIRSDALAFTLASGSDGFVERANINRDAGEAGLNGNDLNNTLIGNSRDNLLIGFSGDDILNGGGGSNALFGGSGDDAFVVDTATDSVFELGGGGTDLVRAESDFTLPEAAAAGLIENLRMQGGGAISTAPAMRSTTASRATPGTIG